METPTKSRTLAVCKPFAPSMPMASSFQPLNHTNLASHTKALQQTILDSLPPALLCRKRTRAISSASSSPSSLYTSVFLSDNDPSESGYESQTSIELSPSSRSSSSCESQQKLTVLHAWRSSLKQPPRETRCSKKVKTVEGHSLPLITVSTRAVKCTEPLTAQTLCPSSATHSSTGTAFGSRTGSSASTSSSFSPPAECKIAFVDNLVDATVRTLDVIWNASATSTYTSCDLGEKQTGLPLQLFVRETLRRGRASCSTLQAALLYCVRLSDPIRRSKASASPAALAGLSVEEAMKRREEAGMLKCPRRMFLAAVMAASKFLQDRTYSNRAWSRVSGLPIRELGKIERCFLAAIDYRLVVTNGEWEEWAAKLIAIPTPQASTHSIRRSSFARSASDNVTGMAIPLDTELHVASFPIPSQVPPKSCTKTAAEPASSSFLCPVMQVAQSSGTIPDVPLPYPLALSVRASSQI